MLATAAVHSGVMFSDQAYYRRLIAYFSGPLQETIACFSGPSSLTFSAKSANLELKGGENKIFSLCMIIKKVISFIYEKIFFGDRVPLSLSVSLSWWQDGSDGSYQPDHTYHRNKSMKVKLCIYLLSL